MFGYRIVLPIGTWKPKPSHYIVIKCTRENQNKNDCNDFYEIEKELVNSESCEVFRLVPETIKKSSK